MPSRRLLGLVVCVAIVEGATAHAQRATDFTDWVYRRIAMLAAVQPGAPGAATKQVETPSIADGSTSLVDTSGAPDLVGLAFNFLGVGDEQPPTTITVSAYAVRSALAGADPFRPDVYARNREWRRWSVTLGREGSAGGTETRIVGAKYLLWDGRDLGRPATVDRIRRTLAASSAARRLGAAFGRLQDLVATLLGPRKGETDPIRFAETYLSERTADQTMSALTPSELARVDAFLLDEIAPILNDTGAEQAALVAGLRKAPQLAVSYEALLRAGGDDEHHWLAIFDWGVADRFDLAVNAGVGRVAHPSATDTSLGTAGLELRYEIGARRPSDGALIGRDTGAPRATVSVSVANDWRSLAPDIHKAQVSLNVPLPGPFGGVVLPISFTVANRTELVDETDVRGQFGFTIDFAKLQQAIHLPVR